jgi:DNA-binding NarL/FixJ family response regulator
VIGKPKDLIAAALARTAAQYRLPLTPLQIRVLAGAAAEALVGRPRQPEEISWEGLLTANQRQLLTMLANGAEETEIAHSLQCHRDTVRSSLKSITDRLGTTNRIHTAVVGVVRQLVKPADIHVPAATARVKPGRKPKELL